jgi:hypothetical protein
MLNLPQSTCGYPNHLKIETCRQNALLHTRFVWQTYEFPGHSNENDDVRFGSKAAIGTQSWNVRFVPKADILRSTEPGGDEAVFNSARGSFWTYVKSRPPSVGGLTHFVK